MKKDLKTTFLIKISGQKISIVLNLKMENGEAYENELNIVQIEKKSMQKNPFPLF